MSLGSQQPQITANGTALTENERRVLAALADIRYGAVEITIHDGRIVQIERREKLRMDSAAARR